MPLDKWVVLISGAGAIVWLNWHFVASTRRTHATGTPPKGTQVVVIRVNGSFDPPEVRVRARIPVRLVFERSGITASADEVVITAFGIRSPLDAHGRTLVELGPIEPGEYKIESATAGLICALIAA